MTNFIPRIPGLAPRLVPRLAAAATALLLITFSGCSSRMTNSPDVADSVRKSLDASNLKDVTSSQDREKGVITLGGNVGSDEDKSRAESLAKALAGTQVVSNQIAVLPAGDHDASKVNSELDRAIEHNLEAALLQEKLQDQVRFTVTNHTVTLTGAVTSRRDRTRAEAVAMGVPNVAQVVNELQIARRKATSSE